jgi:alkanesulfonate monooxygenase SsuD/methylene tetrahydromethanopterin reductase-like flavin-dependent oxidoreductase (luciferase family)
VSWFVSGRAATESPYSRTRSCIVGATSKQQSRARELYAWLSREESFEDWLTAYTEHRLVGSTVEVADQLRAYEQAGCDRVIIIHPLHWDLESVGLIAHQLLPLLGSAPAASG